MLSPTGSRLELAPTLNPDVGAGAGAGLAAGTGMAASNDTADMGANGGRPVAICTGAGDEGGGRWMSGSAAGAGLRNGLS